MGTHRNLLDRRDFLHRLAIAAGGLSVGGLSVGLANAIVPGAAHAQPPVTNRSSTSAASSARSGKTSAVSLARSSEFVFARLRYDSGDWDYNPKVCANLLDAVVQYTGIPVQQNEVVITADSAELLAFPFLFMTGHKLVRFSEKERQGLVRFVDNGGLLFSDDCNHDVNGLYARSFEGEMRRAFNGPGVLAKLRDKFQKK